MFRRILNLLGLGHKVDAIGASLDETKAIIDETNAALRARIGLDTPDDTLNMIEPPKPMEPVNGHAGRRKASRP